MPTLYVENVPKEIYEALRSRARKRRRSMSAEVMAILEENIPTASELRARRAFVQKLKALRRKARMADGTHLSAEQMVREDRDR